MAETVIGPDMDQAPIQLPFMPGVSTPEACTIVIFGATGDLAGRKLLPALFGLWRGRLLPEQFSIVGVGRRDSRVKVRVRWSRPTRSSARSSPSTG